MDADQNLLQRGGYKKPNSRKRKRKEEVIHGEISGQTLFRRTKDLLDLEKPDSRAGSKPELLLT
jgi:hypothetical protein